MADDVRDSIEVFDVEDANGDVTEAVYLDQLENWLAEHDREVAEKAWDEGFDFAEDTKGIDPAAVRFNPYRVAAPADVPTGGDHA